jgi:hypothetical protein
MSSAWGPFQVYDRAVEVAAERHGPRVADMKRAFEEKTGAFGPEDAWFEARSRALWDDALVRQGFAREVAGDLPAEARGWLDAIARSHRGLFRASEAEGVRVLRDVLSGAEFVVHAVDDGSREALEAANGYFDARVACAANVVAMLPGAVYHPEDATPAIDTVIEAARARGVGHEDVLDALLRMERKLRSLSRVKAAYAYRADGLAKE